jgi:hypothetical protein
MVLNKIWQKLFVSLFIAAISILSQLETLDDILIVNKDVVVAKNPVYAFEFITNFEEYPSVTFKFIIFLS